MGGISFLWEEGESRKVSLVGEGWLFVAQAHVCAAQLHVARLSASPSNKGTFLQFVITLSHSVGNRGGARRQPEELNRDSQPRGDTDVVKMTVCKKTRLLTTCGSPGTGFCSEPRKRSRDNLSLQPLRDIGSNILRRQMMRWRKRRCTSVKAVRSGLSLSQISALFMSISGLLAGCFAAWTCEVLCMLWQSLVRYDSAFA